jgi:cell division transport system permease protein
MFWINIKRTIKAGWINFRRNGLVSSAAVLVTTITLATVMGLFVFRATLESTIKTLQSKVDIAVFFTVTAPEDQILSLKNTLEQLPEVATVAYQSADDQVLAFRTRHADDYLTLQALDELVDNPIGGSLTIQAKDSTQYEAIRQVLEGDTEIAREYAPIIDRTNYAQNQAVIDRLNHLVDVSRKYGLGTIALLSLVSVVIMYTTVRLTIYMSREEIAVMRLVGASRAFVRSPFIVEGMLYGFFAWLLTLLIFFGSLYFLGPRLEPLLGFSLYGYLLQHILFLGGSVLVIGLFLGAISSVIATGRYLRV